MKHNWTYKKLGEVATLTGGFTPKADELFSEGKYPYFKVSDMNTAGNEVVLTKTPSFVVDSKKCYPKGAIVFPKNGAAVSTNKKRILGQDSIVDLNTCAAILNSDIDIKFAYYWFYNLDFKTLVRGGALPTLDLKGLRSLQIPIPSLDEQKSIVQELDGINRLIDLQEEQLREYDRLAQSLFYTTFGDPTTNPKGWEVKKLGEISTLLNGRAYSKNELLNKGKYRILRVGNFFTNDSWYYSDLELDADKYCDKGDLLFAWSASFCARIWEGEKVIYHYHIWKVLCDETQLDKVFYCHLLNNMLESMKKDTHGTGMVHLTKIGMEQYYLPLPPLALQQTFAAQIEAIEQQKALIRRSLDETRTLLAARMQYYFE